MKNNWDIENEFYWSTGKERLNKALAHYEIYKKIVDLPGDVVELGVFKGASLIRFLSFRDLLETPHSRKVIGLDNFGDFPHEIVKSENDISFINRFNKEAGMGLSKDKLEEILRTKGFENYQLIQGDVFKTIPDLLEERPEMKISLLHLDMDVYEPTIYSLEKLFSHVVKNGIIVVDDYSTVYGATKALDEFIGEIYELKKLPFYKVPSFFIKK